MLKRAKALFLSLLSLVVSLPALGSAVVETSTRQLNMPQGVTEVSQAAYDIHMIMVWVCTVIGVGVFGFMFYVMYAHRKSRGAVAENFRLVASAAFAAGRRSAGGLNWTPDIL